MKSFEMKFKLQAIMEVTVRIYFVTAALCLHSVLCDQAVQAHCGFVELRSVNNSSTKSVIRIETPIGSTVLNNIFPKCQKASTDMCNIINFRVKFQLRNSCNLKICDYIDSESCLNYKDTDTKSTIKIVTESTIFHCACSSYPNEKYNVDFNREYVGVVFQPYTKQGARWNNYTVSEVKSMLQITSTKFSWISTYGIGSAGVNSTWKDGDASGFVPVSAALINRNSNEVRLRVLAAIWQNYEREDLYLSEITNAFMASKEANEIYPNTVFGIIFTSNSLFTIPEWQDLRNRLKVHRSQADRLGLKIGIRLSNCGKLLPPTLVEANNDLYSAPNNYSSLGYLTEGSPGGIIFNISAMLDFVICHETPKTRYVNKTMSDIVNHLGNENFLPLREFFATHLPHLTFFGQTGWPSQGVSDNLSINTIKNQRDFWDQINKWSSQNKVKIFMFEAMDEPYKIDTNIKDETISQGVNGAESHYGWWKRSDNHNSTTYIEKYTEIPAELVQVSEAVDYNGVHIDYEMLAVIVSVAVGLLVIFVVSVYLYKRQKSLRAPYFVRLSNEEVRIFKEGSQDKTEESDRDSTIALRFPYDKSWEIAKKQFSYDKTRVLGSGSGGVVYRGHITGIEQEVAFKTTGISSTIAHVRNLLSEIKLLSYIGHHNNIVKFIGAHTENIQSGEVCLAIEYCSLGSLLNILRHRKYGYISEVTDATANNSINVAVNYVSLATATVTEEPEKEVRPLYFADLVKWCYEIADAMEFISNKKIVHADLACRNILLTADQTAKITDFGLSRKLYKYAAYLRFNDDQPLPWNWMAPESLKQLKFSTETDIWSFGVTLWEIFSLGDIPYPGLSWSQNFLKALELGVRLQKPSHSTNEIYDRMRLCWNADPNARIKFEKLKDFFRYLHQNNPCKQV